MALGTSKITNYPELSTEEVVLGLPPTHLPQRKVNQVGLEQCRSRKLLCLSEGREQPVLGIEVGKRMRQYERWARDTETNFLAKRKMLRKGCSHLDIQGTFSF